MGVENVLIDVIVFLVQRNGVVVVLVYLDVYLIVILAITEVAIHAMMCLVGVIGLLVVVEAVELETVNNAQVLLNYLNNIHCYNHGNNQYTNSNNYYNYNNMYHT